MYQMLLFENERKYSRYNTTICLKNVRRSIGESLFSRRFSLYGVAADYEKLDVGFQSFFETETGVLFYSAGPQ